MKTLYSILDPDSDARGIAWGGFLLRLSLGAMWISHALLKILVFTLPGAAKFFNSVGLPGFLVYPVVAAELLGGFAILLGYRARAISLLLLPILAVAAWVHWPNGWVFTAAGGGWEYPVFLVSASIVLALVGDGAFALSKAAWRGPARVSIQQRH